VSASDDINVEAGLARDHELRKLLAVCRYSLAAVVCLCALLSRCQLGPHDRLRLEAKAGASDGWRAQAEECQRWTQ
jgi:hypothetical protein